MNLDLAAMEVVASGTSTQIKRWCRSLRAASIQFALTSPCRETDTSRPDYTELWVHQEDADKAHSVIRNCSDADSSLLW
jgi:hypothetical protein